MEYTPQHSCDRYCWCVCVCACVCGYYQHVDVQPSPPLLLFAIVCFPFDMLKVQEHSAAAGSFGPYAVVIAHGPAQGVVHVDGLEIIIGYC